MVPLVGVSSHILKGCGFYFQSATYLGCRFSLGWGRYGKRSINISLCVCFSKISGHFLGWGILQSELFNMTDKSYQIILISSINSKRISFHVGYYHSEVNLFWFSLIHTTSPGDFLNIIKKSIMVLRMVYKKWIFLDCEIHLLIYIPAFALVPVGTCCDSLTFSSSHILENKEEVNPESLMFSPLLLVFQ